MTDILARLTLPADLDAAQAQVEAALQAQGFGVLTFVDVQRTLADKLGVDFRDYRILGACNPALAHRALQAEARVGLLLPCNIVLERTAQGTQVTIPTPQSLLERLLDNPAVRAVADEAHLRLTRVAQALAQPAEVAA